MNKYSEIIKDETNRALWEVRNVISCVGDDMWNELYCQMPLWKHIYHMLHSLDRWFINPSYYVEPAIHEPELNNLDFISSKCLSVKEIDEYYLFIEKKIKDYLDNLTDDMLLAKPNNCEYDRFTLIMAQHRHLHSHMGMIMGFIIAKTDKWPYVLGLTRNIPTDNQFKKFFL